MEEVKMINLGVYYEHLKGKIEELTIKMKKEKDPYAKWNLAEQKKLTQDLLSDYNKLILKQ